MIDFRVWLPKSIYERVPQFYVLAGLLLIADGLYVGFEFSFSLSYFYFAIGLPIMLNGVRLFILRRNYRNAKREAQADSGNTDSTADVEESESAPEARGNKVSTEQSLQH